MIKIRRVCCSRAHSVSTCRCMAQITTKLYTFSITEIQCGITTCRSKSSVKEKLRVQFDSFATAWLPFEIRSAALVISNSSAWSFAPLSSENLKNGVSTQCQPNYLHEEPSTSREACRNYISWSYKRKLSAVSLHAFLKVLWEKNFISSSIALWLKLKLLSLEYYFTLIGKPKKRCKYPVSSKL